MKTSPLVIAALLGAASAGVNVHPDVEAAKEKMNSRLQAMVDPKRFDKFNDDLVKFDATLRAAGNTVREDLRSYDMATRQPKLEIDQALYEYIEEKADINADYAKDYVYARDNIHYDAGKPGGEGKLQMSNPQKVYDNYKDTAELQQAADAKLRQQVQGPNAKIQQAQRVFEQTAQREWPARFQAVGDAWRQLGADYAPQSLVVAPETEREVVTRNFNNVARTEGALGKSVVGDGLEYWNSTVKQRAAWQQDVETYMKENQKVQQQMKEAWDFEMDNMEFTDSDSDGQVEFEVEHPKEMTEKWRNVAVNDVMAKKKLIREFKKYQASIATQKRAFAETARAQWPAKFQAWANAIKQYEKQVWGINLDHMERHHARVQQKFQQMQQPHALITDEQQTAAEQIRAATYEDLNDRLAFKWQVKKDLKAYIANTAGARDKLKQDAQEWQQAGKNVMDMYKAAWDFQIQHSKFTPATQTAPATIELEDPVAVSDQWRTAAQADENLGDEEVRDIEEFIRATRAERSALKDQINAKWVPDMQNIHEADIEIIEDVAEFPWAGQFDHRDIHEKIYNETQGVNYDHLHPQYPNPHVNVTSTMGLMQVDGQFSHVEVGLYGVAILATMIGAAHLANKKDKKNSTIEFEVSDLEMPRKESKKQIKKTLKSIMKQSNTKTTLINN